MTLLAIVSRVLIFGGGKTSWLYGYMIYYIIFGSLCCYAIARKHYPYATVIADDKMADSSNLKK